MYWIIKYAKFIAIGAVSISLFLAGWFSNGWRWESKYQELVLEHEKQLLVAQKEARQKEQSLQEAIDKQRADNETKIHNINSQLESTLEQLRQRPERTSGNPKDSCNCKGANGSKLFREDAQFLIREAARADRLATELKACYASYDSIRAVLNKE